MLNGRLRAFNVGEERELAGRVAGLLYLTGAVTAALLLVLPGPEVERWQLVLALASAGGLWGVACLTVVPWWRVHPIVSHVSSGMGFPIVAIAVACTGGASSPATLYLLFIVVYAAYFYPLREAVPHLAGCIAVAALPLAYDPAAVDARFHGEVAILAPTYLLIFGMIHAGKRRMIDLRDHARGLSLRDPLTGVANRRALLDSLEGRIGGTRASDAATALILVDLDGFKDANTLYGHPVGDEVLRRTADALQRAARAEDLVARLGGDEFAVVMGGADEVSAGAVAERVLREVRRAGEELDLPELTVTASIGWALHPTDAESIDDLIASADLALRASKAAGKDRAQSPLDWHPDAELSQLPA